MASTNIDEVFNKIETDFVKLSKNAAKSAANKAQKDIREKADEFITEYYKYKPTMYKNRKKALYKLVQDYYRETETAKGISIEFGVTYDPSKLGPHESNSWYHRSGTHWIPRDSGDFDFDSQNNGIPDSQWIVNKFWEGIHPSGKIGDDGGVKDEQTSDEKMQKFFDKELDDLVNTYMNKALLDAVSAYF